MAKQTKKVKVINPYNKGVSYAEFNSVVLESKKSIAEYCKGFLSKEEIDWIEIEIEHFNKNNK